jgi:thiol:disulfide interchange protein DsbA
MTKHFFRTLFSGVALLLCLTMASVYAAEPTVERLSRTFPRATSGKIEVIEFFSYACGHCNDFHPIIMKWANTLPADVQFRRVAIGVRQQWVNLSRLYYTLESLGELKRLDNAVFDAVHKERRNDLVTKKGATRWYVEKGGNAQKFTALYDSFGIMSKVNQAENLAEQMGISSVPALVVDGQYKIHADSEFSAILKTADQLIESARKK